MHDGTISRVCRHRHHGHTRCCISRLIPSGISRRCTIVSKLGTELDITLVSTAGTELAIGLGDIQTSIQLTTVFGHQRVHDWSHGFKSLTQLAFLLCSQIMDWLAFTVNCNLTRLHQFFDHLVTQTGIGCVVQLEGHLSCLVEFLALCNEDFKVLSHRLTNCLAQRILECPFQGIYLCWLEFQLHKLGRGQIGSNPRHILGLAQEQIDTGNDRCPITFTCSQVFNTGIDRFNELVGHAFNCRTNRRTKDHGSQRCLDDVTTGFLDHVVFISQRSSKAVDGLHHCLDLGTSHDQLTLGTDDAGIDELLYSLGHMQSCVLVQVKVTRSFTPQVVLSVFIAHLVETTTIQQTKQTLYCSGSTHHQVGQHRAIGYPVNLTDHLDGKGITLGKLCSRQTHQSIQRMHLFTTGLDAGQ